MEIIDLKELHFNRYIVEAQKPQQSKKTKKQASKVVDKENLFSEANTVLTIKPQTSLQKVGGPKV